MPEISVVLSVYNDADYVGVAIESVLAQTFIDFEFIIIDDASTDESLSIVRGFADERIRIVENEENLGLTKSLNKGISLAQGKYIARMDSDDISLPMRFEKQVAFLNAHPDVGVCGGWIELIGDQAGVVWEYPTEHDIIVANMLFENQLAHASVMMRREILEETAYDEAFARSQDYDLWVRLVTGGVKLANLSEILLQYRLHSGQVGVQHGGEQILLADRVRLRQLQNLGLTHTKYELLLHQKLSTYQFEQSGAFLKDAADWLEKIERANCDVNYFEQAALQRVLGERWWATLKHLQGVGWQTWRAYWRSPLRAWLNISLYERLKLFLYCLWHQVRS